MHAYLQWYHSNDNTTRVLGESLNAVITPDVFRQMLGRHGASTKARVHMPWWRRWPTSCWDVLILTIMLQATGPTIPWLSPEEYFDRYIVTLRPCADYEILNVLGGTDPVRRLVAGLGFAAHCSYLMRLRHAVDAIHDYFALNYSPSGISLTSGCRMVFSNSLSSAGEAIGEAVPG